MRYYLLCFFCALASFCFSQDTFDKQKVLFVLDASGSMEAFWGEEKRMDIAVRTLSQLVDSLEKSNPNIEVALRVFGHQYHKSLNNCTDSKLEIPFSGNNAAIFSEKLKSIKPNGNTPIAYSLIQSANDFNDVDALNSIILITDGLENCEGNPCDAVKLLKEKRITINPFIIGLDIEDSLIHSFDCIGTFINAKSESTLKIILENTVKQATGKTSLSINLLSSSQQVITNTPFSIIDPVSNKTLYTFVHSITKQGLPDTLYIDPRGYYQVIVHTYAPFGSQQFQLTPSVHNTLNIQLPKSFLDFMHEKQYDETQARFIVRKNDKWIYNFDLQDLPLLENSYQINTTLLPLKSELITLKADKIYKQSYPQNGKLSIENKQILRASIFKINKNGLELVYDIAQFKENFTLKLQPGDYTLIYILDEETNSDNTHRHDFTINAARTTVIQLK